MFEYIFFDAALRDKFVAYAKQRDVDCITSEDNMGLIVAISEDIPDEIADEIEDYHDELQQRQAELSEEAGELNRLAGFRFNLPDGQSRLLPLQPEMANRLIANFSLEEIQGLFNAVAYCTLNTNSEHLCQILAAKKEDQA